MRRAASPKIIRHERLDSTNAEARRYVAAGHGLPVWITAAEQTAGRGRMGRNWQSVPGNLYATYVFESAANAKAASQISFVAALAVLDVVQRLQPDVSFQLKWPNDVLLEGAKFCGILAEVIEDAPLIIAVGCGINLTAPPADMPYPVSALGGLFTVNVVLAELALSFSKYLEIWNDSQGFSAIRDAWLQQAQGFGQAMTVDGKAGIFVGLAVDGALLMQDAGGHEMKIYAGDVRLSPFKERE